MTPCPPTTAPPSEHFARVSFYSSLHLEPSNILAILYVFFYSFQGDVLNAHAVSPSQTLFVLVSMTPTVSTIPELRHWNVVLYTHFICTWNLSNGDASDASRNQNSSRSPITWSSRWASEILVNSAQTRHFHSTLLSEAVWDFICHFNALILPRKPTSKYICHL